MEQEHRDFFISYRSDDLKWAEWIGWQLEEAHYSITLQAWDFLPGVNFIHEMDRAARQAKRTIVVLSPAYFTSDYTQIEWQAAFEKDPTGKKGLLIPVKVQDCNVEGLLGSRVYIDLVGLDEATAREKLLAGIAHVASDAPKRAKPTTAPNFPSISGLSGSLEVQMHIVSESNTFPSTSAAIWNLPLRRNPFFIWCEQQLARLHDQLTPRTARGAILVAFIVLSFLVFVLVLQHNIFNTIPTQQAQSIISKYFGDINKKDYQDSYAMLSSKMQVKGQSLTDYVKGFSNTQQDTISIISTKQRPDGSVLLDVTLTAVMNDGSRQIYTGYYIIGTENGTWKIVGGCLQKDGSTSCSM